MQAWFSKRWGFRSGASFEKYKMAIVHFTLNQAKNSNSPITIDNTEVVPAKMVKILAVYSSTISAALREHVTHAAAKGRRIGYAIRRLD